MRYYVCLGLMGGDKMGRPTYGISELRCRRSLSSAVPQLHAHRAWPRSAWERGSSGTTSNVWNVYSPSVLFIDTSFFSEIVNNGQTLFMTEWALADSEQFVSAFSNVREQNQGANRPWIVDYLRVLAGQTSV